MHDLRCLDPVEKLSTRLDVKGLDELLDVFLPVPPRPRPRSPLLDQEDYLRDDQPALDLPRLKPTDPVLEISSISSASGKTQLLYYLTALAVLPSSVEGVGLGGRDSAVIFIDSDGRFDADRLQIVTAGILRQKLADGGISVDAETVLVTSLQHVHVFRPQSSSSLLATLQSLDSYLFDLSRHFSSARPLHAIIIDSASAFFWQDKLRDEVSRIEDIGRPASELERERQQKQSFYLSDLYAELVSELKRLQRRFSCAVIYTSIAWGGRSVGTQQPRPSDPFDLYNPPVPSASRTPSFRTSLPPPWGTFPSLRLVVQRDATRPFPPGMTIHDTERDAAMRHEVVLQGKFSGWVNGWGRDEWPSRIVDGVERANGGMFAFYVKTNGVYCD